MRPARDPFSWRRFGDAVLLAGALDERADFTGVVGETRDGAVTLDCAGITFVNSLGLRAWIRTLDEATAANVRVELCRVVEPVVHQLNLVVAARGTATVSSFYAPYVCEHCDTDARVLLDVGALGADLARGIVPAHACPSCKRPMTFAEPRELYLQFLAR